MCSAELSKEASTNLTHPAGKPSIEVTCSLATAQALATSLVDCTISSKAGQDPAACLAGYHLLCHLALADVQAGNERMKGVAQNVTTAALKVGLQLMTGCGSIVMHVVAWMHAAGALMCGSAPYPAPLKR